MPKTVKSNQENATTTYDSLRLGPCSCVRPYTSKAVLAKAHKTSVMPKALQSFS